MGTAKFNTGNRTSQAGEAASNTIERQFTPEKVLKAVIEYPKKKRPFSQLANVFAMSKNHGDTVTQEVRHGMMAQTNVLDGGIDANTATMAIGKIINSDGTIFLVNDYLKKAAGDWDAAVALAKAAAVDGGKTVATYQPNGLINGKSSIAAYKGAILPLPEEGGVLNGFMSKSTLVSATLSWHMIHTKYTQRSADLDSRVGMVARHIADLGDVLLEAKEGQLQASIQATAALNSMPSTSNPLHIATSDIDGMDVLTYAALEQFALELQDADVPMDTEVIKGVDVQDTLTVSDAYIMYVNRATLPTLTRMKGADETTIAWMDKKHYAAGTTLIEGEVGSVDGLPFRFVVVDNLQVDVAAGELLRTDDAATVDDAANAATAASAHSTVDAVDGGRYYDVYSALVIGADSFSVTGFGYNSTKAVHVAPKRDVHVDLTGSVGAVVADWSYAFLAYRPERIAKLQFSLQKNGVAPVAKA